MNFRKKNIIYLLFVSFCLAFVPVSGYAKEIEEKFDEASVVEVADFADLKEAVAEVTEGEGFGRNSDGLWQNKRLLVKGEAKFDCMGASNVIYGYEDMVILDYDTKKEAKQAYDYLKTIPNLAVEIDAPFEETLKDDTETIHTEVSAGISKRESHIVSGRQEVLVAVLDSGYDIKNCGQQRLKKGTDLTDSGSVLDMNGHGTAMANIILEHTPENVKVMPVKVTDKDGRTSSLKLYMGIRYAIENQADVINISMNAIKTSGSEVISAVIREARQAGVVVIVSAGNMGQDVNKFSPADEPEAIVVSAVSEKKVLEEYSNRGLGVDYCSYGSIQVSGINGKAVQISGTSVSAAIVSALVAVRKGEKPDISYEKLLELLNQSAEDLGEKGKDELYGNGLLAFDISGEFELPEEMKKSDLLACDWKEVSLETFNQYIGTATNLERRAFLEQLSEKDRQLLLSRNTMFSEKVLYIENTYTKENTVTEVFRMEGRLYDIVMSEKVANDYEVQAYRVFHYGQQNKSYIQLDTAYNTHKAKIYCWITDRSTDLSNSGTYGITFVPGNSAYDFSECTSGVEDTDTYEGGLGFPVWRLNVKKVKVKKPKDACIEYSSALWNDTGKLDGYKVQKHYWYIWKYQVKPASDAARQEAYGKGCDEVGKWHGGFWDLGDSGRTSGGKCGSDTVTTAVDIGNRDLDMSGKEGITYRLPMSAHQAVTTSETVIDTPASCTQQGLCHTKTTYTCNKCDKTWKVKGASVAIPRLAHVFAGKYADHNGVPKGKYWEECIRNCSGYDVNGEYWQRNIKYLQELHFWEMDVNGNYSALYNGADRVDFYCTAGDYIPQWSRLPSEEYQTGFLDDFLAPEYASYHSVYIPRKQYTVLYDGNGAEGGSTPSQQVYCGRVFHLSPNGFYRTGYEFLGFSQSEDGEVMAGNNVKNLTLTDQGTVTLYAQWKPIQYEITLDHQGANKKVGTRTVYEHLAVGYFKDITLKTKFEKNRIEIPQKNREDSSLAEGIRKQNFLGYYTKRDGEGNQVVKKDGSLVADINGKGAYQYFRSNQTVYAKWEDMNAVSFDANLSKKDKEILGMKENQTSVTCPALRWKKKGEAITIGFGKVKMENGQFSDMYRLKGYSLTPKIKSEDEIVLSSEKAACTFTADEDVTLYAQWDTDFRIAYIGNEQSEGENQIDESGNLKESYLFLKNYFHKTIQKPVKDTTSGQMQNEAGKPYMETIPYSFQGWSMVKEKDEQEKYAVYHRKDGKYEGTGIILAAKEVAKSGKDAGLTFGAPSSDYGSTVKDNTSKIPYINMYAVWDEYPQIQASDLYIPLADAQNGILTEEYLLNLAVATDKELESDENKKGILKHGKDEKNNTSFTILDYQLSEFEGAESEMSLTVTYRAEDKVGNITTKQVTVYLVDTAGKEYDTGKVRFISAEYIDTLAENSIWRTEKYAQKLEKVLKNQKTGEEYTKVTPVQKAFGIKQVKKPDSGTWAHVQEVWKFTHDEVLAVQEYVRKDGVGNNPSEFLKKFGHCRIQ